MLLSISFNLVNNYTLTELDNSRKIPPEQQFSLFLFNIVTICLQLSSWQRPEVAAHSRKSNAHGTRAVTNSADEIRR